MPSSVKRTFELADEEASFIDRLVAEGSYATPSDVVQDGLRALREQDETIERWLREEVIPVYDAMMADPGKAIPADVVRANLRQHHDQRMKGKARAE